MKKCEKCGKEFEDSMQSCDACGGALTEEKPQEKQKKKHSVFIVAEKLRRGIPIARNAANLP